MIMPLSPVPPNPSPAPSTSPLTSLADSEDGNDIPSSNPANNAQSEDPAQRDYAQAPRTRTRYSREQKIFNVLRTLSKMQWNLKEFLSALRDAQAVAGIHRNSLAWGHFLQFAYSELPEEEDFESIIGRRKGVFLNQLGRDWFVDILRLEIKALCGHDIFGSYGIPDDAKEFGSLSHLKDTELVIRNTAPQWTHLISAVVQEKRSRSGGDPASGADGNGNTVLIFARLCNMMRPTRCANFQTLLGLYLYQGGTRRRVLDTLNQLGLTVSYRTVQRRLEEINVDAKRRLQLVGQTPNAVITWDNFEYTEGRRGERTGEAVTFRSITTALQCDSRILDPRALTQSMWRPHIHLLSAIEIAGNIYSGSLAEQVRASPHARTPFLTCRPAD